MEKAHAQKPPVLFSRLTPALIMLNLGGLVALFVGFLYLNQFRESMIDARIESLATQGAIIAAVVAQSATGGAEDSVGDPEKLLKQQPDGAIVADDRKTGMEFSLSPEIGLLVQRLMSPTANRARIYDRDGYLLLDTAAWVGRLARGVAAELEAPSVFSRVFDRLRRWALRPGLPLYQDIGMSNGKTYSEVTAALTGEPQAIVRANAEGETIVSVAALITHFHKVTGALLLSTTGETVDKAIASERRAIIRIFLVSAGVMLLLSLMFANSLKRQIAKVVETGSA